MKNLLGLRIALTGVAVVIAVAFAAAAGYPAVMVVGTMVAAIGFVTDHGAALVGRAAFAGLRLGWVAGLDVLRQAGLVLAVVVLGADRGRAARGPRSRADRDRARAADRLARRAAPSRSSQRSTRAPGVACCDSCCPMRRRAIGAVYVSLVVVLTSLVASQEETGYFSAAFRVFSVLSAVPSLLVASAFPILARAARDNRAPSLCASAAVGRLARHRRRRSRPDGGRSSGRHRRRRGARVRTVHHSPPDHGRSAVRVFLRGHLGLWGCFPSAPIAAFSRMHRACRRGRACACPGTRIWSGRSRLASLLGEPCSRLRSDFSRCVGKKTSASTTIVRESFSPRRSRRSSADPRAAGRRGPRRRERGLPRGGGCSASGS